MKYYLILISLAMMAAALYIFLSSIVPSMLVFGALLMIGGAYLALKAHGKI